MVGPRLYGSVFRRWSLAEDAKLLAVWDQHDTVEPIVAQFPDRTAGAVIQRASRLGLRNKFAISWTPDEDELVRTEWRAGSSASEIAALLSYRTRNAVIGRVHRLGIAGRTAAHHTRRRTKPGQKVRRFVKAPSPGSGIARLERSAIGAPLHTRGGPFIADNAIISYPITEADTAAATVSFSDLEPHHCRAIVAEHMPFDGNRKIYCGERRVPGKSYCACHVRRYENTPEYAQRPSYVPLIPIHGHSGRVMRGTQQALDNAAEFLKETT